MSKATRKYLEAHAEPEARRELESGGMSERMGGGMGAGIGESAGESEIGWSDALDTPYRAAVVVPLHSESIDFLAGYREAAAAAEGRILLIAVVNARDGDRSWVHAANESLLTALTRAPQVGPETARGSRLVRLEDQLDVLCVDRASPGHRLPPKQGVGLARKIGCDLALSLRIRGCIESDWIYTSDADVRLPKDYFRRALGAGEPSTPAPGERDRAGRGLAKAESGSVSAATFPFRHRPSGEPALDRAVCLYELSLRYYVLGLHAAESPYAFHTIGSTLCIEAEAYARVRGFPRREAGEDFYLLNKLAKQGEVRMPRGAPIEIRSRTSLRVPFGTGAATARIVERAERDEAFQVYAPESFELLRCWRLALDHWGRDEALPRSAHSLLHSALQRAETELERRSALCLGRALELSSLAEQAALALGDVSASQISRRIHEWFDAFRTLKLIHALRDAGLANLPWWVAFERADFLHLDAAAAAALHARSDAAALERLQDHLERQEPARSGLSR